MPELAWAGGLTVRQISKMIENNPRFQLVFGISFESLLMV